LRGRAALRRSRRWPWAWPRAAVVRANGIADLARIRALRLLDRLDDDAWWRQRTRFFGERARERLHELIVDFLTAELAQETAHLEDVFFVTASLLGALLQH
jgi:hypothetical protein